MKTLQDIKNVKWATDVPFKYKKYGEIANVDVINQSIEHALGTITGEVLFNTQFGSPFFTMLFETMDVKFGENLLKEVTRVIKTWEDRVILLENEMGCLINTEENYCTITVPYIIKNIGIRGEFKKNVSV